VERNEEGLIIKMMNDKEIEVFKRYENGEDIREEDRLILEYYERVGYVKGFGYSFERGTQTAILTEKGRRWLHREKIFRNPVKRFFHNWYACLVR
jgi:hypothetical protein